MQQRHASRQWKFDEIVCYVESHAVRLANSIGYNVKGPPSDNEFAEFIDKIKFLSIDLHTLHEPLDRS